MSQPPKVDKVSPAKGGGATGKPDKAVEAYKNVNLEPAPSKKSPPARTSTTGTTARPASRSQIHRKKEDRDPFGGDDEWDDEENLSTETSTDSEGYHESEYDDFEEEHFSKKSFDAADKKATTPFGGGGGQGQQRNRKPISFFQDFIESGTPSVEQKKQIDGLLRKMMQQTYEGMQQFAFETPQHQALGKSYNLCKHALSALVHDDIATVKALIQKIMPRKQG